MRQLKLDESLAGLCRLKRLIAVPHDKALDELMADETGSRANCPSRPDEGYFRDDCQHQLQEILIWGQFGSVYT